MSIETALQGIKNKQEELEQSLRDAATTTIAPLFSEIFEQHPEVKAIKIDTYIPGFNDGEPCVYSLGEWRLTLRPLTDETKWMGEDDEDDDGNQVWFTSYDLKGETKTDYNAEPIKEPYVPTWGSNRATQYRDKYPTIANPDYNPQLAEVLGTLERYSNTLGEIFERAYGYNVTLIFTPSGVEIEDYDCGF